MEEYQNEISCIKELLKKNPRGLNIREIADKLKINRNSVAKYLDILTTREEVDVRFHGMAKVYYLSQGVPVSNLMKFSSKYIVVLNRDLRVVQANDAFIRLINMPREQILDVKFNEISAEIIHNSFILDLVDTAILGKEIKTECALKDSPGNNYYSITLTPTRFQDQSCGIILIFEDITEKKEIENALKKSEAKFRNLIENLSDVVFSLAPDGAITYVSPQVTAYGYKPEEVISKKYDSFIHPEEREEVLHLFSGFTHSRRRTFTPVFRTLDSSGSPVWVECNGRIQRDETGNVIGICGVLRDITGRRHLESALAESESLLRTLFDCANDSIFLHHMNKDGTLGRYIMVNEKACLHLGYSREELLTMSPYDISSEKHLRNIPAISRMVQEQEYATFTAIHKRKDGTEFPVEISTHIFSLRNQTVALSIARDITERKRSEAALLQSEEQYRSLVELLPDAVAVYREGRLIYVNPACVKIMGGISAEDFTGKPVFSFIHPDDQGLAREHIRRMTDAGYINPLCEERFLKLNGEMITVEVTSARGIFNGAPACIAVFRDITNRKMPGKCPERQDTGIYDE